MGCGLHARVPQLKPLPDAVHRITNGAVMAGAVAMELVLDILCAEMYGKGKKKPAKITSVAYAP